MRLMSVGIAACWSLAGGCSELAVTSDPRPLTLRPVWTAPLTQSGGFWLGQPAVDGGRLFVQAGNQLVGLDAATGAVLWARGVRVAAVPPPTTLLATGGLVFVSEVDSVLAVEGSSGRTVWAFHPDSQAVVAPALDGATLYTGQRGLPVVYALDRADGHLRWRTDVDPGRGTGYPALVQGAAVSGDTVYVAVRRALAPTFYTTAGLLVALDRRDGRTLWRYDLAEGGHHGFTTGPLLAGRLVIVGDFDGQAVLAYDPAAGAVAWRATLPLAAAVSLTLDNVLPSRSRLR